MRPVLVGRIVIACVVATASGAHASDYDWAYELPDSAKEIFRAGQAPNSCDKLRAETHATEASYVIRDAGIFRDRSCADRIARLPDDFAEKPELLLAIRFYRLRLGDESQVAPLLDSFDRHARKIGDHFTVELFGFLPDWEHTGRRLARHSRYSGGASSELLYSALLWKRFLYGQQPGFRESCLRVVEEERVSDRWVPRFCGGE